ncbi:MAG TPA: acetolactate synthase [Bacillota bacterium]|nr:acetolactate synthase [Bacillota bacterium]HPE38422.1 acetolactate synthase [Bacillota bacterium]
MLVKQINVFLENQSGRLAEVTKSLSENQIDIRALYIADTTEYGILRMILDKPDDALLALTQAGFTVSSTPVIAIAIKDVPGTLDQAIGVLSEKGLSLEYLYGYVGRSSSDAVVVIRVSDPNLAVEKLTEANIRILSSEEVYGI